MSGVQQIRESNSKRISFISQLNYFPAENACEKSINHNVFSSVFVLHAQ